MSTGLSSAEISNRVEILVDNQIANQDKLKSLQGDYKATTQAVKDLSSEIAKSGVSTNAQAIEMRLLSDVLEDSKKEMEETKASLQAIKEALKEMNAEARRVSMAEAKAELDKLNAAAAAADQATEKLGEKQKGAAQLARAASYAFQDLAQGGLAATINNMDQMGSSMSKVLGIGKNLGPALQALSVAAFLVVQNWETLRKLWDSSPDKGMVDRIHRTKEAMKELEKQAETSIAKFNELRMVQARLREEEAARKGGIIERKATEEEAAGGKVAEDYIARVLKGSFGPVFDNLGEALRGTKQYQDDPWVREERAAIQAQAKANAEYARMERAGEFKAEGGADLRAGQQAAIDAATARIDATVRPLAGVMDRMRETMFGEVSRMGKGSEWFDFLRSYLEKQGQETFTLQKTMEEARAQAAKESFDKSREGQDNRRAQENYAQSVKDFTERQQKQKAATTDAEQARAKETTDALGDYSRTMQQAIQEMTGAVRRDPSAGAAEEAKLRQLEIDAFQAMSERLDRLGGVGSKQAAEGLERAAFTQRDMQEAITNALHNAGVKMGGAADKQDRAADRNREGIERALEKTKLEGYASALISQYGETKQVASAIAAAVRQALAGTPMEKGEREAVIAAAPRYFKGQAETQRAQMMEAAGGMGANAQQQQMMINQQIFAGLQASVQAHRMDRTQMAGMQQAFGQIVIRMREEISQEGAVSPYGTGIYHQSYIIQAGQPGPGPNGQHRLMYEERRTAEVDARIARLERRVQRLEQLLAIKNSGGF